MSNKKAKVVIFANSKGGVGKTTSCTILACAFAEAGNRVTVIDADPNHPHEDWEKDGGKVENLKFVINDNENNLEQEIENARDKNDLVIVDLEGTKNISILYSIKKADLVIIPMRPTKLDGRRAADTIQVVKAISKKFNRNTPYSLLFTNTSEAIRTKAYKRTAKQIIDQGIDLFETELFQLQAFAELHERSKSLSQLNSSHVSNLDKAKNIAESFAVEVKEKLKTKKVVQPIKELETIC
ncbi:ParA family protein [Aquimarina macrocephali]|uniref:ParA family protein n=1 Tax=Aquimarina macrocephali TaxID=666563 RepID=UPI000466E7F5|nr:ParA family protein [Aquimarina macrocephali]